MVNINVANADEINYCQEKGNRSVADYHNHTCGGFTISENYFIIAAHCFYGDDIRNVSITVGANMYLDLSIVSRTSRSNSLNCIILDGHQRSDA